MGTAEEQTERQKYLLLKQKYPNGVNFDEFGFPRFEPYAVTVNGEKAVVKIKTTGDRGKDFLNADKEMRINAQYRKDNELVWHHVEDTETMILVPKDIHEEIKHTGGISVYKNIIEDE